MLFDKRSDSSSEEKSDEDTSMNELTFSGFGLEEKDKRYILKNGTLLTFNNTHREQQLYIDSENPDTFADLSIANGKHLKCAGEKDGFLYFYVDDSDQHLFYRACLRETVGKQIIDFQFIRAKRRKGKSYFAVQQPFILEDTTKNITVESFDGQWIPLVHCAKSLSGIARFDEFFCHRGRVYLLLHGRDTQIVNAGHLIIVYIAQEYFLDKDGFLKLVSLHLADFSVYAPDDSPVYVMCHNAVMVIGPSLEFFFVRLKTNAFDYIAGVQNSQIVIQTKDGLVKTNLGKQHEELLEQLRTSDLKDIEISLNRDVIARLYAKNDELQMNKNNSGESNTKRKKNGVKSKTRKNRRHQSSHSDDDESDSLSSSTDFASKFSSEFTLTRILGQGGFGIVFEAENKLDEWKYAVKRIAVPPSEDEIQQKLREVRTMSKMDHPGIVRYNGTWLERPPWGWQLGEDERIIHERGLGRVCELNYPIDSVFVYIQMQLCEQSLKDWLDDNREPASRSLSRMKSWFKQIVEAVDYIHSKGIFHRDLKPANILFSEKDRLKVCDLGISAMRKYSEDGREISTFRSDIKTILYMAPEQDSMCPRYSSRTDIFSLGLIFAELCVVMRDEERQKIFNSYRRGNVPIDIYNNLSTARFVSWIAAEKSKKRPTCSEIIEHPFLKI